MICGCKQLDELVREHARRRATAAPPAAIGRRLADESVGAVLAKFAPMRANVEAVRKLEAEGKWPPRAEPADPSARMIDPRLFNDPLGLRQHRAD